MKTSIIIVTYNRKEDLQRNLEVLKGLIPSPDEIVVVNNASTDGTHELFPSDFNSPLIRYVSLDRNLGVAAGRNRAVEASSGDILVFLDDDTLIEPQDFIAKIARRFCENPRTGVLAFKVVNYYRKDITREEFPHVDKSLDPNREFETTYFIGAGHAIRRKVFEECGYYPEDYFYGMEELDLSFRAIDWDYDIVYFPEVTVWHKKSPQGRLSGEKKWAYIYRNRLAVSFKYLKYRHLFVLMAVWFLKVLKESASLTIPVKGVLSFLSYKKVLRRKPISNEAIGRLKKMKGRVWF